MDVDTSAPGAVGTAPVGLTVTHDGVPPAVPVAEAAVRA
jgi:hypothetical protein